MGKTVFHRRVVLSGRLMGGTYRYRDTLQIFPIECSLPESILGHHPIMLECQIRIDEQEMLGRYPMDQYPRKIGTSHYVGDKVHELLVLLSTFTNYRFFQYRNRQSWFTPLGTDMTGPFWGQEMFFPDEGQTKKLNPDGFSEAGPAIAERVHPNEYYNRYMQRRKPDPIDLPDCIDALFDRYFAEDKAARHAFFCACQLCSDGIGLKDHDNASLALAALVSSIETLVSFETRDLGVERCRKCGKLKRAVAERFRDFMTRHGSDTPEYREYADDIYEKRCDILHEGLLLLGDTHPGSTDSVSSAQIEHFIVGVRICLVNWLRNR